MSEAKPTTRASRPKVPAPEVTVVVPTRNEAGNITPLVERIGKALEGTAYEICFVDDSDDTTTTVLAGLEENNPSIRCRFRYGAARAGGLSTAVIEGMRMAHGKYACVMDADLQHPPELIPRLLEKARSGSDLVVASRYTGRGSAAGLDGAMRRWVSSGARGVAKVMFSEARRSSDPLSGFFLCRRELVDGIEFRPVGFKILLELLVCVPGLKVTDVSLNFERRASGESKATLRQGWTYLRHVWSLFSQVSGSARPWKFATVGVTGLAIYLGLLELLVNRFDIDVNYAFFLAFAPSLAWNTVLNRIWTFSDRRGPLLPRESLLYLLYALLTGALNYGCFRVLLHAEYHLFWAGLISTLFAMTCNALINAGRLRRRPLIWSQISTDAQISKGLARLAKSIGADRSYVLPPDVATGISGVPNDVLRRVATVKRAALWTEAASHRAQRRTNIDLSSTLLVPVVNGGQIVGIVVCERTSPTAYPANALEKATRAVEEMVPALVHASGDRAARLIERMALRDAT
jgi:dolichol-phosphate mannosyltransferase